ncbi:MAG: diguanylate cyclase, partial [Lachnospiraceae bacterium]|nr:diguanylate cyclase [Lachnospiraceae bacterium]
EIAEGLRKHIEEYDFPEVGKVTCSIGITKMEFDDTVEDAFERMDKALYKAKEDGRNCVRAIYTEE